MSHGPLAKDPALCSRPDVEPIHLHHVQAEPDAPAGQAGAEGHLPVLPPGREDRRARPQRLRQVHAAADHGGQGQGVPRRRAARSRRHGRDARAGAAPRREQGRARQRRGRRRGDCARCSTASTSSRRTTPTRRRTSSRACRSRSTPPTPGTSTRSSTRPWTPCACRPPDADVTQLSGGERRRVALCRLLLSAPDLLLLDEPTNHLDAESVAWLEQHLEEYKGTVVAVTHDRYFLDNVAGWILELDRGHGLPFKGNYSSWLEQKQARLAQEERQESARQRTIERELEWVRENPKGRRKKAKARLNNYERLRRRGAQRPARLRPDPHPGRASGWAAR